MEQLPGYISIVFILTSILTISLLFKSINYSKSIIIAVLLWLGFQAAIALTGFYTVTNTVPPRFGLLLLPPIIFIVVIFLTKTGRQATDTFDVKILTLLHIIRIPVEITLYYLFLHKVVPRVMTFEGRNFDILCGLTAPFVYYFGYLKHVLSRKVLLGWNIVCLMLLANIVVTAVLSAPFRFQKFGFDHPGIALFYFPFVWLPGFIVPAALFAHLVTLRQLANKKLNHETVTTA